MNFKNIFKNSLKLSWRNKYLWFFGLFAVLLGNNNEYEILSGSLSGEISQSIVPGLKELIGTNVFSRQTISGIGKILAEDPLPLLLLLFFALIVIILIVFLVWLVIISQAALVNSSANIINKKSHNFQSSIVYGMKKFWPIFILNLLSKIIVFIVFFLLSLTMIIKLNIVYLFAFIILVPLAIIFSFMVKYAIAFVVIRQDNLKNSISKGWELFKNNWFVSIKMAFLLFAISLAVILAIYLLIANLNTIFAFITVIFVKIFPSIAFWLFVVLKSLLGFIVIMFASVLFTIFQISAWTNLFLKISEKNINQQTRPAKDSIQ